jgi:hypothetical protein
VPERDPLRHELPDHDVEEGQNQVGESDGEDGRQEVVERVRERLLAERADAQ